MSSSPASSRSSSSSGQTASSTASIGGPTRSNSTDVRQPPYNDADESQQPAEDVEHPLPLGRQRGWSRCMRCVCGILLLVVIAAAVVAFYFLNKIFNIFDPVTTTTTETLSSSLRTTSTTELSATTTERKDSTSSGRPMTSLSSSSAMPATSATTTTKSTTPTTATTTTTTTTTTNTKSPTTPTTTTTTKPNTATTSTETTTAVPSKQRAVKEVALYCTASVSADTEPVPMDLPDDGVCDYMLFDSLYHGSSGKFPINDVHIKGELEVFLIAAKGGTTRRQTQYGVGFNFAFLRTVEKDLQSRVSHAFINQLWQRKIVGYGVLSINKFQLSKDNLTLAVTMLETLLKFTREKNTGPKVFTVIGIFGNGTDEANVGNHIRDALSTTSIPTVIILLAHLNVPNNQQASCIIQPLSVTMGTSLSTPPPPNALTFPFENALTFAESYNTMENQTLAISTTMKARRYQPFDSNSYSVYKNCKVGTFEDEASPVKLCDDQSKSYSSTAANEQSLDYQLIFDTDDERLYLYEVKRSLHQKFCSLASSLQQNISIAVYDVNYDGRAGQCPPNAGSGGFQRVKFLRKIIESYITGAECPKDL